MVSICRISLYEKRKNSRHSTSVNCSIVNSTSGGAVGGGGRYRGYCWSIIGTQELLFLDLLNRSHLTWCDTIRYMVWEETGYTAFDGIHIPRKIRRGKMHIKKGSQVHIYWLYVDKQTMAFMGPDRSSSVQSCESSIGNGSINALNNAWNHRL